MSTLVMAMVVMVVLLLLLMQLMLSMIVAFLSSSHFYSFSTCEDCKKGRQGYLLAFNRVLRGLHYLEKGSGLYHGIRLRKVCACLAYRRLCRQHILFAQTSSSYSGTSPTHEPLPGISTYVSPRCVSSVQPWRKSPGEPALLARP